MIVVGRDYETHYNELHLELVRQLQGRTNPSVLELGCGEGAYVRDLRELGFDAHGMDMDAGNVAAADFFNVQDYVKVGDAAKIEEVFPDRKFDAVVSAALLDIVSRTSISNLFTSGDLQERMQKMKREAQEIRIPIHKSIYDALKPGGFAIHVGLSPVNVIHDAPLSDLEKLGYQVLSSGQAKTHFPHDEFYKLVLRRP